MLYGMVSAGFEYVVKSDYVAFDVYVGIGDGISYACLRRKVNYGRKSIFVKKLFNKSLVGYISFYKYPF